MFSSFGPMETGHNEVWSTGDNENAAFGGERMHTGDKKCQAK